MAVLTVLDAVLPDSRTAAVVAGGVGLLAAARAVHWGTRHTPRHPLLWILHAGYAWLILGLLLREVAVFYPAVPASLATHALTVGAIGSLTLGMMARVSLGHGGRPMVAARATVWAFAAISAAAVARVVVPMLAPGWYFTSLLVAGSLWTVAFLVYLVSYGPVLWASRLDGKPG